jgi:hypothetical protein
MNNSNNDADPPINIAEDVHIEHAELKSDNAERNELIEVELNSENKYEVEEQSGFTVGQSFEVEYVDGSVPVNVNSDLSADQLRKIESCMICTDDMIDSNDIHFLQCFHRFHIRCISRWLTVKAQCPICKFPANIDIIGVDDDGKFISASGHIINNGVIEEVEEPMETRIGRAIDLLRELHESRARPASAEEQPNPPIRRRLNLRVNINERSQDPDDEDSSNTDENVPDHGDSKEDNSEAFPRFSLDWDSILNAARGSTNWRRRNAVAYQSSSEIMSGISSTSGTSDASNLNNHLYRDLHNGMDGIAYHEIDEEHIENEPDVDQSSDLISLEPIYPEPQYIDNQQSVIRTFSPIPDPMFGNDAISNVEEYANNIQWEVPNEDNPDNIQWAHNVFSDINYPMQNVPLLSESHNAHEQHDTNQYNAQESNDANRYRPYNSFIPELQLPPPHRVATPYPEYQSIARTSSNDTYTYYPDSEYSEREDSSEDETRTYTE